MRYFISLAVLICGCAYTPPNKMEEAAPLPVVVSMPVALEAVAEPTPDDVETASESTIAPLPATPPTAPSPAEPVKLTPKPTPEVSSSPPFCPPCYQPCYQPCYRRLFRRR